MEIKTKEQAQEAIDAVCKWLQETEFPPLPESKYYSWEKPKDKLTRNFCFDLLDAAGTDGWGGCPLCLG